MSPRAVGRAWAIGLLLWSPPLHAQGTTTRLRLPDSLLAAALQEDRTAPAAIATGWKGAGSHPLAVPALLARGDFARAHEILDAARATRRPGGRLEGPAEANPLWLAGVYDYWLATADTAFVRRLWPMIFEAYSWGLRHDSDGDLLLDSSAAGPGLYAAGHPGPTSHQDMHLAATWLEALRATADLAAAVGDLRLARTASQRFELAWGNLERRYYLADRGTYAVSIDVHGRPEKGGVLWVTPALASALLEIDRVPALLDSLAALGRLQPVGPFGPPAHLPGLAAWGSFNYHRPHAGLAWLRRLARRVMTVSADEARAGELRVAVLRGLLGMVHDAPRNSLAIRPHLPAGWDSLALHDYRIGAARIDLELRRSADADAHRLLVRLRRRNADARPLTIELAPGFPPGSRVLSVRLNGRPHEAERVRASDDVHMAVRFKLDAAARVSFEYEPGVAAAAVDGYGTDIIRYRREDESGEYVLRLGGRGGSLVALLDSPSGAPRLLSRGKLEPLGADHYRLRLELIHPADGYDERHLRFLPPDVTVAPEGRNGAPGSR